MTIASDVAALLADDLAEGGGTVDGTYTPPGGVAVSVTDAIQRNFFLDDGSGRATMEVLVAEAVIASPQVGAKWDNGDGRVWAVYRIDDALPLMTALFVEAHVGTGSQT